MATRTAIADPDELRAEFRRAQRTPQLLGLRDRVRQALRQASDTMTEAENGDSNGDDMAALQALFAQLRALLDEVDSRLSRQSHIDDLERRMSGTPLGGSGDRQWDQQQCEFRITAAIAAALGPQFGGDRVDAQRERETSAELQRRSGRSFSGIAVPLAALSVRTQDCPPHLLRSLEKRVISSTLPAGGPGGAIVPTTWDFTQWIDVLRPQLAIRELGARVLDGLTANLNLPKLTQATSSGWFAENTAIITSDEEFSTVQLRPHHAGAILELSRNMLQQVPNPGIESIVRSDLAQVLARAIDTAAISGAGDGITPLGIITDGAVASLPAAAVTYDALVDLTGLLAEANALDGSLGWLADAKVRSALLKLKDQYARPYGLDLLFQGFPYRFSNLAAGTGTVTDPLIFGNFADLVLGMWSELDLLVNPFDSAAYSKGNILIRGACTIDVQKRHVESFAYMSCTGVLAAGAQERPTTPTPTPPARPRASA